MQKLMFLLFFSIFLFAQTPKGDLDKGHTYYQFIIYPMINIKGNEFTIKHTKEQWEKLFLNDAKEFKEKYSSLSSEFRDFLLSKKFKKISLDLKAFFIYYAKDSDFKAQCEQ